MSTRDTGKRYHRECTGNAQQTARKHAERSKGDIQFFAACFCPFVQRVWIALEYLEIPYTYLEVDPYAKPPELLEVSPKGLVPALKLNGYSPPRGLNESTVILEYLQDIAVTEYGRKRALLPGKENPWARALIRLQCDHISRSIVPAFYRYLQAQEIQDQIKGGNEFLNAIETLIILFERAKIESEDDAGNCGLWDDEDGELSLADILVGPWLFRATNVLKHYRGFSFPPSQKFDNYLNKLFRHPAFEATCSTEQLYLDSYERYAFNRPNTSQVADAINTGRSLP